MKLSVIIIAVVSFTLHAQPVQERYAHLGELLLPQFSSAPFPHSQRENGHTYNKQTFPADQHYIDSSVAIFIPKGFKPTKSIDLVIYFHGWYNNIDSACAQFRLIEQFSESNKNALFVFSEGPKNSPDSFGGRMEEKDGLKHLVSDVVMFLQKEKMIKSGQVGNIILAGHSGAFRVMAFCLMRGGLTKNISDVILFDALYAQTEKFSHWINNNKGRLINIYTDDGGTKNETENLMADLDGWNTSYVQIEETALQPGDLKKNRLIFIHSDLTHNGVIAARNQFREFLRTSGLKNISDNAK